MGLRGAVKNYVKNAVRTWVEWRLFNGSPAISLSRDQWDMSWRNPNRFYDESIRFFLKQLPAPLRAHREYFDDPRDPRGFGENAFHTLWYLLLQEFKPSNFLEIGVFRGQVISLVALWARLEGRGCDIWGIAPFTGAGDSASSYPKHLDYQADTLLNFDHFNLPHPHLLRAFSQDPEAQRLIQSKTWDLVYIDGNHDYEMARQDWELCSRNTKIGGVIVLDDSGLYTTYNPRYFATRGHEGPSRLAREMDGTRFREILQVGHNRAFQKIA